MRIRLLFQPEIIAKTRKNTSTFSTAGRAMTQLGGMPVHAGKGVFHGVTGVAHGMTGVLKKGFGGDDTVNTVTAVEDGPSGQASHPIGQSDAMRNGGPAFPVSQSAESAPPTASQESGTLRVTVLDGKDLSTSDCKPYAIIRLGDKEVKTKPTGRTATPEWYVHCLGFFAHRPYIRSSGTSHSHSQLDRSLPSCICGYMTTKPSEKINYLEKAKSMYVCSGT